MKNLNNGSNIELNCGINGRKVSFAELCGALIVIDENLFNDYVCELLTAVNDNHMTKGDVMTSELDLGLRTETGVKPLHVEVEIIHV